MTDYDIEKVSKRPWTSEERYDEFNKLMVWDADGNHIGWFGFDTGEQGSRGIETVDENKRADELHKIHCVNEHEALEQELDELDHKCKMQLAETVKVEIERDCARKELAELNPEYEAAQDTILKYEARLKALEADRKRFKVFVGLIKDGMKYSDRTGRWYQPRGSWFTTVDQAIDAAMRESNLEFKYYGIPIGSELSKDIMDCPNCIKPDKKEDVKFPKLPQMFFEPCEKHQKLLDEIREEEQQRFHRTERR